MLRRHFSLSRKGTITQPKILASKIGKLIQKSKIRLVGSHSQNPAKSVGRPISLQKITLPQIVK